jgi:hypothetical protein
MYWTAWWFTCLKSNTDFLSAFSQRAARRRPAGLRFFFRAARQEGFGALRLVEERHLDRFARRARDMRAASAVGWVEPKAKPTGSIPVIQSRKIIEITQLGRRVVPLVLCEQCATWTRWVSPLALPTLRTCLGFSLRDQDPSWHTFRHASGIRPPHPAEAAPSTRHPAAAIAPA